MNTEADTSKTASPFAQGANPANFSSAPFNSNTSSSFNSNSSYTTPAPVPAHTASPAADVNYNKMSVEYARLQGYLEGYLTQMSASQKAQEELISKVLTEMSEILHPISSNVAGYTGRKY